MLHWRIRDFTIGLIRQTIGCAKALSPAGGNGGTAFGGTTVGGVAGIPTCGGTGIALVEAVGPSYSRC